MIKRHMPDVKVVGVDRGGVGTKHRKCFFHGNQSIKYLCCSYCCDLQFWYITDFFSNIEALRSAHTMRLVAGTSRIVCANLYVVIKFGRILKSRLLH